MKQIILFFICLLPVFTNAQVTKSFSSSNQPLVIKQDTGYSTHIQRIPANKPQKVSANEVIVEIGLFDSNSYDQNGVGVPNQTIEVGTNIPNYCYSGIKNLQFQAIKFALTEASDIKCIKLYGFKENVFSLLVSKNVNATCQAGWNTIQFDTPIEVSDSYESIIPVYEISIGNNKYPIARNTEEADVNGFWVYGDLGNGPEWTTVQDMGCVAIKLIAKCDAATENVAEVVKCPKMTVAVNEPFNIPLQIRSTSADDISTIDYEIQLGDNIFTKTQSFDPAIESGYNKKSSSFLCDEIYAITEGTSTITFKITKINGKDVVCPSSSFELFVISKKVPRLSIIEISIGNSEPWSVRGLAALEKIRRERPSSVAAICIDQWSSKDLLYGDYYHIPNFRGYPEAQIDRKSDFIDPYYGENKKGILESIDTYNTKLPEVALNVEANWADAFHTQIQATATTEFLCDLPNSEIVFVLTGNGIQGSQENRIYGKSSPEQYNVSIEDAPELYEYCAGQNKGFTPLSETYNDIVLGSSWPSMSEDNAAPAFTTTANGETATSTYALSIPTKTDLKNAIVKDKLYVTAFVLKADGTIANAARCKVGGEEIQGIILDQEKYICPVGGSGRAIASTYPDNYKNLEYEWTSSDPSVLFVDKSSGMFLGLKDGYSYITASLKGMPEFTATAIVLVGNGKELITCEDPEITVHNGKIVIQCGTKGADIHYSIIPTASSQSGIYSSEIDVDFMYEVTAYATAEGGIESNVVTKFISKSDLMNKVGDVNTDGEITISDVTKLVNVLLMKDGE